MFEFSESIIYPKDPTANKKRIQQYKDYYKIKYQLCKEQNPKLIVEIGVRAGYSAWTFLQACPNAKYIGIDANNGKHGGQGGKDGSFFKWARRILADYDAELIEIDTQKTDKLKIKNVDFFHVDGDHTSRGVQHDLDLAYNCLSENGMILVDDITYIADVRDGVYKWLDKMASEVTSKFVKSLRGEMIIKKRQSS
jgi:predicted O-methyltransferase YrrM